MGSSEVARVAAELARFPHGRVPADLRRRHVMALAEELFVERGYRQASMDELARRAGVSKPVVYDLVGSKDRLFAALMEQWADELAARVQAAVDRQGDPDDWLRAGAAAFFGFVGEHRDAWGALLSGDDAPVTAAFAEAQASKAAWRSAAAAFFSSARAEQ